MSFTPLRLLAIAGMLASPAFGQPDDPAASVPPPPIAPDAPGAEADIPAPTAADDRPILTDPSFPGVPEIVDVPTAAMIDRSFHVAQIYVQGIRAAEFHYMPWEVFRSLEGPNSRRLRFVETSGHFGPHPANTWQDALFDTAYLFLPVCRGRVTYDGHQIGQLTRSNEDVRVRLECPE